MDQSELEKKIRQPLPSAGKHGLALTLLALGLLVIG